MRTTGSDVVYTNYTITLKPILGSNCQKTLHALDKTDDLLYFRHVEAFSPTRSLSLPFS